MKRSRSPVTTFKELKEALEAVRKGQADAGKRLTSRADEPAVSEGRVLKETGPRRHLSSVQNDGQTVAKEDSHEDGRDEEIFLQAMADVKEIREFRAIPFEGPLRCRPQRKANDDACRILREIVRGERKVVLSDTGEYIEWTRPQTRKDLTRRLHRGDFSVQDYIDLHGMTLAEAGEALQQFIKEAATRGMCCVKVIHGRGLRSPHGPVLKEGVKRWLQGSLSKWVIAFATAKDCDGGLGATYVLLKPR